MKRKNKSCNWLFSQCGKFLQSKILLEQGFKHCFFTKKLSNQSPKRLIKSFPENVHYSIHRINQIHSNFVCEASKARRSPWPSADAIISTHSQNQSLWVYSADCIPTLFADLKTGGIAICHAGWRGLSKNIFKETIIKLEHKGSKREDLLVILGPSISKKNYEVESDILMKVFSSLKNLEALNNKEIETKLDSLYKDNIIIKSKNQNKFLKKFS